MKYKVYTHIHTNEQVWEEDWEQYAMEKLGIKVEPKGTGGTYTTEQLDFIEQFTEWYFSDNWIKEEIEDDSVMDYEKLVTEAEFRAECMQEDEQIRYMEERYGV
jgi:hypothetical protein